MSVNLCLYSAVFHTISSLLFRLPVRNTVSAFNVEAWSALQTAVNVALGFVLFHHFVATLSTVG
jgi:hypothetical protein